MPRPKSLEPPIAKVKEAPKRRYTEPIGAGYDALATAVITKAIDDRKWTWLFDDSDHIGSAHYWILLTDVDDPTAFQEALLKQLELPHKNIQYYIQRNQVYARANSKKRKKGNK